MKRICLLVALVALYVALPLAGPHAWLLRLVGITVFTAVFVFVLLLYGVHPRLKIITGGKLSREGGSALRRYETFFKICSVLVGIATIAYLLLPLLYGTCVLLHEGHVSRVKGTVTETTSYMGLWFLGESIYLDGEKGAFIYFFSVETPPRRGENYTLHVLPKTRLVLHLQRGGLEM